MHLAWRLQVPPSGGTPVRYNAAPCRLPLPLMPRSADDSPDLAPHARSFGSRAQCAQLFELLPLPCFVFDMESLQFLEVDQASEREYG